MEVRVAEHMGKCFGVRDAITMALDLTRQGPVTILGDLVHNPDVVSEIDDAGAVRAQRPEELRTPVVLLTARPIRVQPQTLGWLTRYQLRWDLLIMRDFGDYDASREFKRRTVYELRDYGFDLRLAFEDDRRNYDMFHREGVPCVYIHSGYYE